MAMAKTETTDPADPAPDAPVILGDPAAIAASVDADSWLRTGDIVTFDDDGWFRVTGRIKELTEYNGYHVAPAELEQILLTHLAVADAVVVQSPDESAGVVTAQVARQAATPRRPATAPAYYLRRPAEWWISAFTRSASQPESRGQEPA
jgi:acyl-coenzyme A synthetase/AMP-(fatty) acid ligase